jgi:uncharacterized protein
MSLEKNKLCPKGTNSGREFKFLDHKLIRIEEISLRLEEGESDLKNKIAEILKLAKGEIIEYKIIKKAIDSRKKNNILIIYSVDVNLSNIDSVSSWNAQHRVRLIEPFIYEIKIPERRSESRPIVVGSGPCGLFAALYLSEAGFKPLVIERGQELDDRVNTVSHFLKCGELNNKSNMQFGEGGAGTFSDGKLYSLINDPRSQYIFSEFIQAGAPASIAYSATPHIGTDRLRSVIKNIRKKIIKMGGEFRFNACLTDIEIINKKIKAVILDQNERILTDNLVLAIGHSARDTYEMLYGKQLEISPKPFAIGVRIEHHREMIDKAQYGDFFNHPKLGSAKYKLVEHISGERSVYTFCMCPGGYVMAAASEGGGVVTNGMSEYARDGDNSNSALLVAVNPEDFGSNHPLAGIEFQKNWEKKAFEAGGRNFFAPIQLVGDFLAGWPSTKLGEIKPTYRPGFKLTSLDTCLPDYVIRSLKKAIPQFDKKIKGFARPDAILSGVETRSSSPVRLMRNEFFESNIGGLYPAGEGAGYAGGIISSAIDGLKVAEAIIKKFL